MTRRQTSNDNLTIEFDALSNFLEISDPSLIIATDIAGAAHSDTHSVLIPYDSTQDLKIEAADATRPEFINFKSLRQPITPAGSSHSAALPTSRSQARVRWAAS